MIPATQEILVFTHFDPKPLTVLWHELRRHYGKDQRWMARCEKALVERGRWEDRLKLGPSEIKRIELSQQWFE